MDRWDSFHFLIFFPFVVRILWLYGEKEFRQCEINSIWQSLLPSPHPELIRTKQNSSKWNELSYLDSDLGPFGPLHAGPFISFRCNFSVPQKCMKWENWMYFCFPPLLADSFAWLHLWQTTSCSFTTLSPPWRYLLSEPSFTLVYSHVHDPSIWNSWVNTCVIYIQ